jgi:UDP-N-acetylenolpyruvoylglucosamine reductase
VARIVGLAVLTEISSFTLGHELVVVRIEAIATVRKIYNRFFGRCLLGLSNLQKIPGAAA